mgnify:CR=1 FL=1
MKKPLIEHRIDALLEELLFEQKKKQGRKKKKRSRSKRKKGKDGLFKKTISLFSSNQLAHHYK